ncbi:matrix protein [Wuhan Insect virus 6]|uniref:Matrix protein n=1 Tax=Wuhan Insect virus 6 TaxID=1608111 RepID=A0A0B5KF30_9RHAB|nr:matrix protein [Wuhan Insect virus 6]AJG39189.1 matrix protein [Wuhan Insect virus 6]
MEWYNCSIFVSNASLDVLGHKNPSSIKMKELHDHIMPLFRDFCKLNPLLCGVLSGLIKAGRVRSFIDTYTSSLTGPNTKRINFTFDQYNIIPMNRSLPEGKVTMNAVGKVAKIKDYEMMSYFIFDIIITKVNGEDINTLLKEHPTWFCGMLDMNVSETSCPCDDKPKPVKLAK